MIEQIAKSGIYVLDADYVKPNTAAIHIVRSGKQVALVDTGTTYSLPNVEKALSTIGLTWDAVRYIILTHIHLDHAGGASAMMKAAANATLVVHPKGARHMVDPARLIAGSEAVYGKKVFQELYGEILPIEESRILAPNDGETLDFNGRMLTFLDSPGHANHHHCIWDQDSQSMFTGDTLGIAYKALRDENTLFLMPTTTPVQFDPQAMHNSIDKIMAYAPKQLYLTHFGGITPTANLIANLHQQIDDFVALTENAAEQISPDHLPEKLEQALTASITSYLHDKCAEVLPSIDDATRKLWIDFDAKLDAQGLSFWYQHRRAS